MESKFSPKPNFLALRTIAFVIGTIGVALFLGSLILGSLIQLGSLVLDLPGVFIVGLVLGGAVAGVLTVGYAELILLFVNIEDQTYQILHWVKKSSDR